MVRFILRNLLKACLLVLVVSFVVFVLVDLSPVDPVQANVGQAAYLTMSEAKRAQLEAYWGVGEPLPVRYGHWLAGSSASSSASSAAWPSTAGRTGSSAAGAWS